MKRKIGGGNLLNPDFILEKARLKERDVVADLGCGSAGQFIFPAAEIVGSKGKVYAIDIMKSVLTNLDKRIEQEEYNNIQTIWSDLEVFKATELEPESLDVGLMINTLYQSQKRAELLRESIRLIKRGGYLLVVEWKNTSTPIGPPPDAKVKKESLSQGAQKLGLTLEEEFEAGEYHYGMLFVK
jgi:ubiquinone/menaquinone biosynthesis C-methylase UbiE